jgi:hypothetical protein
MDKGLSTNRTMNIMHSLLTLTVLAFLFLDSCGASLPHKFDHTSFPFQDDDSHTRIGGDTIPSFQKTHRRGMNGWELDQHNIPGLMESRKVGPNLAMLQRRRNGLSSNDESRNVVLLCNSPPWIQERSLGDTRSTQGIEDNGLNEEDRRSMETFTQGRRGPHPPIVYRYYGRSRPRMRSADSIPFVLFGPNVDHWKTVGQILATRGFSVMACERLADDGEESKRLQQQEQQEQYAQHEGANIVLEILDALRWSRAIVVGCDSESILAIETAMQLAPDRISGLVLCGDLSEGEQLAINSGVDVLDDFLRNVLDCPFTIIWDGGGTQASPSGGQWGGGVGAMTSSAQYTDRSIILGGGSAPHRIRPEQFAWVLTRFAEAKVPPAEGGGRRFRSIGDDAGRGQGVQARAGDQRWSSAVNSLFQRLALPFGLDNVASSEGRLLLGRAIATALFYIAIMRVAIVQYGLLRTGLRTVKSRYDSVDALRRRAFQAVAAFIVNFGYIPRLFSVKLAKEADDDEDGIIRPPGKLRRKKHAKDISNDSTVAKEGVGLEDGVAADTGPQDESKDEPVGKDGEKNEDEPDEPPRASEERGRFQPFFFLDQVVT